MEYFDISKAKLRIPNLWDKDWENVIDESDEDVKILIKAQYRAVCLLKNIEDISFSFKRAAWLLLWTRLFKIIEGTRSAASYNSELILEIIERILFEYQIQVLTIAEENQNDRLSAFSAWCLYNDYQYQESLLSPDTMDGIWDIDEEKNILKNQNEELIHKKLFAPLNEDNLITDNHKAKKRKFVHKNQEHIKRDRIKSWFSNDEIKPWIEKIQSMKYKNPSFFQIFDENQKSFFKRLEVMKLNDKDLKFAYIIYKKSSMKINGSSFHNPLIINSEIVFPKFTGSDDQITDLQKRIGKSCYDICVVLTFLRDYAWGKDSQINK